MLIPLAFCLDSTSVLFSAVNKSRGSRDWLQKCWRHAASQSPGWWNHGGISVFHNTL